jgi:hypothetical protein
VEPSGLVHHSASRSRVGEPIAGLHGGDVEHGRLKLLAELGDDCGRNLGDLGIVELDPWRPIGHTRGVPRSSASRSASTSP